MFHFLQVVVNIQDENQLSLWIALLKELILRYGWLVPENVREHQAYIAVELPIRQVLELQIHPAFVFQEILCEFLRNFKQQMVDDSEDARRIAFYEPINIRWKD